MQFSLQWILELCPVEESPDRIAEALTSRGLTVDSVEARGDDHVLEIDVPANRPDCLGHRGVARELSAAFSAPRAPRPTHDPAEPDELSGMIAVEIDAPELCSRYTARLVRDVKIGPSPAALARRIEACGMRSINNVVDASNLVLLETGNPIHFFDLTRVRDARIRVRTATAGETLTTLDGVERELDPEMLLIADGQGPTALAGVMGGADSEIGDSTRDVLIESAWFQPRSVRRTSRRLGLATDASFRFERGVDAASIPDAQALAVHLLVELAGGRPVPGMVDVYPAPRPEGRLSLRLDQLPRLLGYAPARDEVVQALTALGLRPSEITDRQVEVTVPSWRVDLEREADLVEEVGRHLGYDRIPIVTTELIVAPAPPDPEAGLAERARDQLTALGFHESLNYAMVARREDDPFVRADAPAALELSNPISETMAVLRRSLVPGLLRSVERNVRHGNRNARLFEIEQVFFARDGQLPAEPTHVALAWTGDSEAGHWSHGDRPVDFFDLAGVVDALVTALAPEESWERQPTDLAGLRPGRSASWRNTSGTELAWGGELHPQVGSELDQPVYVASVALDKLALARVDDPQYGPIPKLGSVARDLAVVLDDRHSFRDVARVLAGVGRPSGTRPAAIEAIDRYEGPPLAAGQSSLTVRVTLQPDDKSLTESEIEAYRGALVEALDRELGLRLRE